MSAPHPFAAELAERVAGRSDRRLTMSCRTLLEGFGFYRRSDQTINHVQGYLKECGLTADLTLDNPRSLDERVAVMSVQVESATRPPQHRPKVPRVLGVFPPRPSPVDKAVAATVEIVAESASG